MGVAGARAALEWRQQEPSMRLCCGAGSGAHRAIRKSCPWHLYRDRDPIQASPGQVGTLKLAPSRLRGSNFRLELEYFSSYRFFSQGSHGFRLARPAQILSVVTVGISHYCLSMV